MGWGGEGESDEVAWGEGLAGGGRRCSCQRMPSITVLGKSRQSAFVRGHYLTHYIDNGRTDSLYGYLCMYIILHITLHYLLTTSCHHSLSLLFMYSYSAALVAYVSYQFVGGEEPGSIPVASHPSDYCRRLSFTGSGDKLPR